MRNEPFFCKKISVVCYASCIYYSVLGCKNGGFSQRDVFARHSMLGSHTWIFDLMVIYELQEMKLKEYIIYKK